MAKASSILLHSIASRMRGSGTVCSSRWNVSISPKTLAISAVVSGVSHCR